MDEIDQNIRFDVFRALFMFETWALLSSIKFFLLFPLMGTITCFLDRFFMAMLM